MKKLLSMLLCVATILALCAVPAVAEEPVEIDMFISSPEYADAVRALIDAYKEVAPNVTINYETTQNDYPTLLKTRINAGMTPDIFSTTSGKEIADYIEYSYNFAGEPAAEAMDPAVAAMMTYGDGEIHGFALKGNYFGLLYNKAIFEEVGIEVPKTLDDFEAACEAISAAGYQPVSTGFAEWWVFKHVMQHFLDAASDDPAALVAAFQAGEAHIKDYPVLYDNFFRFIDLAVKYGDAKPLETDLAGEEAAFGVGEAAMILGQGAWVEADILAIDDAFQMGFAGYPVTDDPAQSKMISGSDQALRINSDQALRINKDSENLQAVLDFVNWWYTSDYGKTWFCDVAGVIPPISDAKVADMQVINQGGELAASEGADALSICYSSDSFNQAMGEAIQAYIGGTLSKDECCAQIEAKWVEIDGSAA